MKCSMLTPEKELKNVHINFFFILFASANKYKLQKKNSRKYEVKKNWGGRLIKETTLYRSLQILVSSLFSTC